MKVLIIILSYLIEYQNINVINYNETYAINKVYFKPVNNLEVKQVYNLSSDNKNYQRYKRFQVERKKKN